MLLAGLGIAVVPVVRRPRVAVLCTGRELVDDPARPLGPSEIRNTNAVYLRARLPAAGAELAHYETVTDEPAAFAVALERAVAAGVDIVLSTGAVSMGRYDFVPQVLESAGARVRFHKVAMRPGKPLLFARLAQGPLFFGLPGNPVSTVVGLRFFVEAAIRVMLGLPPERGWHLPLLHEVGKKRGFRLHQKARLQLGPDARIGVELLKGQESFKTRSLMESAVWATLPAEDERLPRGSMIEVFPPGHEAGVFLGSQTT
jgi:molybdopterin molybdotransferase